VQVSFQVCRFFSGVSFHMCRSLLTCHTHLRLETLAVAGTATQIWHARCVCVYVCVFVCVCWRFNRYVFVCVCWRFIQVCVCVCVEDLYRYVFVCVSVLEIYIGIF